MINLDALQKAAESTDYDLPIKPAVILKLIEVARAAKLASVLLDEIGPNYPAASNLLKALDGTE